MPTSTSKKRNKALLIALGMLGAALALYLGFAAWLRIDGRYAFRTTLNGTDVSLQRALNVQRTCMQDYYANMSFDILAQDALPYRVTPLSFDFSDAARAVSFLPKNTLLWPASLFSDSVYATGDGDAIDKLARRIEENAPAFRSERWRVAQNAGVRYDEASGRFRIVSDTDGTEIDRSKFEAALENHVRYGHGSLDLSAVRAYRTADIRSFTPELVDACERLNRFLDSEVVYAEGGVEKRFAARTLLPYVSLERDFTVRCDMDAAAADGVFDAFAAELAASFDSPGITRDFITHDGSAVPVAEKTWRAKLDPAGIAAALASLRFEDFIAEDGPIAGQLVWERAPLDALQNYVEVDLTRQTLYLYTDGAPVLETPIVSGSVAQQHTTPGGAFTLMGKHRNVTLRGPGYASFVRWWMPFNNKIGLHDAGWRSKFGGTIYQTNGSHGCVNLPREVAETVYNTIDDSYAIVCYWRPAE